MAKQRLAVASRIKRRRTLVRERRRRWLERNPAVKEALDRKTLANLREWWRNNKKLRLPKIKEWQKKLPKYKKRRLHAKATDRSRQWKEKVSVENIEPVVPVEAPAPLFPLEPVWRNSFNDPLLFATGILGLLPPGEPNPDGKFQLEPWQAEALRAIGEHDRVSIRSGHGVGKTALVCIVLLWFLLTRVDCKIPVAANSDKQLRDTVWPELRKWTRMLPPQFQELIEITSERAFIKAHPDEAFAVRRTASKDTPEALQGFHAGHLLFILEEASGIPDIVMDVALGALSTPGAKVLCLGNPTRTSGFFYETHHALRDRWYTMQVSSEDVPRARGHINDIIARYGKESNAYRVRVLGEFPTADSQCVIPLELVMASVKRAVEPRQVYPVWGLDVARFGDDRTALAKRKGNILLEPVTFWRKLDTYQTAGRLLEEYEKTPEEMRPKEILVDVIGLGAGVVDAAYHHGLPVRGINVGEAGPVSDRYRRLRDELWFRARDWFMGMDCSIPKDDELIKELTTPYYDIAENGKIVVESKADLRLRVQASPDLADAFLLTFAASELRTFKRIKRYRRFGDGTTPWAA